jgi:NADH-quinone oxidoreductase subunit D
VTQDIAIGLSPVDSARTQQTLSLTHHSPVAHGMLRLSVTVQDDLITDAQPILGAMHRGAEKLFESRDYRQVLMLANRHEWLSAFSGEVAVAQLVESALGLEVPETALWLRTLMLEINRVTAHLAFVAGFAWQQAENALPIRTLREQWVEHVQQYSGSRMHPMLTRIGGLSQAPTHAWLDALDSYVQNSHTTLSELRLRVTSELDALQGVGVITSDQTVLLALSGPVARASGYSLDLRASSQREKYSELTSWNPVTQSDGDVPSRLLQLLDELHVSLNMIGELAQMCAEHNEGDINVLLPKVLRVPEGTYEHSMETPLGIASWFLVSRGDKLPYKLKLRPASLHTALALPSVLRGAQVSRLEQIVSSMPFVAGDIDR